MEPHPSGRRSNDGGTAASACGASFDAGAGCGWICGPSVRASICGAIGSVDPLADTGELAFFSADGGHVDITFQQPAMATGHIFGFFSVEGIDPGVSSSDRNDCGDFDVSLDRGPTSLACSTGQRPCATDYVAEGRCGDGGAPGDTAGSWTVTLTSVDLDLSGGAPGSLCHGTALAHLAGFNFADPTPTGVDAGLGTAILYIPF